MNEAYKDVRRLKVTLKPLEITWARACCPLYTDVIIERYDIELPDVLEELTDALCSSTGSLTDACKIKNTLQTVKGIRVSNTTVANYLNYLTESFLFSNAKRYDVKGKKYFDYPSKYYCTDEDGILHLGLYEFLINEDSLEL